MQAFVFTDGVIGFATRMPKGKCALLIAEAPAPVLRQAVSVVARHGYDGETLLVPGVPEAETSMQALEAVLRFKDRVQQRINAMWRRAA